MNPLTHATQRLARTLSRKGGDRLKLLSVLGMHLLRRRYIGVFIDPILACNLRCQMCYFSDPEYRATLRGKLTTDDCEAIAPHLFPQALRLQIGCGAEPTLTPETMLRLVQLGKKYHVPWISVITNGNALTEETLQALVTAGLSELTLSLHGTCLLYTSLASVLIQRGTLHIGDFILAGSYYGRVRAMYNEYNKRVDTAGLSTAVSILGFNGAPTAGDDFNVMESEQEARELAVKREQLQREQGLRTQKMLTLDDIGRRIAVGNFQQFNLIIKGDVDGSVQALANSLIELSTKEIQVSVIHQGVGQITESDIQLATASDAVIIGFQVRPSAQARKLAEQEGVEIRTYSIIYDAIEDVRDALEGMLSPDIREQVTANLEVLQTFKVSKIGTIAGCMVTDGKIKRTDKVRVIRDGVVIHTGQLESLKRFKDEAKEVVSGLECGINIKNYNNLEVGDIIESFEEIEVRRKL